VKKTDVLEQALTVRDLIEALEEMDQDAPMVFASDYGDICHTTQALPVGRVGRVGIGEIEESAYSHSGLAIRDEGEEANGLVIDDDYDDYEPPVVVLRGEYE